MGQKECRQFRTDLRNRDNLDDTKNHILGCPECRKAILASKEKNVKSSYVGDTIEQILNNIKPIERRSSWRW